MRCPKHHSFELLIHTFTFAFTILPLHWFPVVHQIKFNLATVTCRTLSTQQPTYLINLVHFSDISKTLRSSISKQLFVRKTKLNIGKRAFSVAAQQFGINPLLQLNHLKLWTPFVKKLKTYLLEIAFPP